MIQDRTWENEGKIPQDKKEGAIEILFFESFNVDGRHRRLVRVTENVGRTFFDSVCQVKHRSQDTIAIL